MTTIFSKDTLRASVEAATGGRCTVLYTEKGRPCYMHVVPRFNVEDIDPLLGEGVHPAFIVGGQEKSEIFYGMFPGTIVDGELLSMPGVEPTGGRDFDAFLQAGRNSGPGFHLVTNAEWAAIQLWCMKNGYQPRGNTNYGRSHESTWETARRVDGQSPGLTSGTAKHLNGSGPAAWSHDGTSSGIADLVGNVWEWVGGMRLQDGEIQILPNNDAALHTANMAASSNQWRAILLSDGSLVAPGTPGTAKYDATSESSNTPRLNSKVDHYMGDVGDDSNSGNSGSTAMSALASASGVVAPAILKVLGLVPHVIDEEENKGTLYVRNFGERLPTRGGLWTSAGNAGLGALLLYNHRGATDSGRGGRLAKI